MPWKQLPPFTPASMTTAQRDTAFPDPPNELTIFNTDIGLYQVFIEETWKSLPAYVKVAATSAPTVDDDADDGYNVGDRWLDTTADEEYVCLDSTAGAAVWISTTYTDAEAIAAVEGEATLALTGDVSIASGKILDMLGDVINNVADPVLGGDAVNLDTLLDSMSIALQYFFAGSSVMAPTFSAGENHIAEVVTETPQELTTIIQVASAANTPAPFTINAGEVATVHFDAKVFATSGKKPTFVYAQLGYVDANGSSNWVQIGANSDPNPVALTTAQTMQEQHIHFSADTTVPAGKRLKVKWYATTTGALQNPTIWVYYGAVGDHIHIPVSASILGNYLPLAGGTMTGAIAMGGNGITGAAQGIGDNALVTVDGPGAGAPANGEYAKWTASGLEGKSLAELRTDLAFFSEHTYPFVPDAVQGEDVTVGDQQGIIHHSGDQEETVTAVYLDAETAPTGASLIIEIEYGDTDSLDSVTSWTVIDTVTLTATNKSVKDSTPTQATLPANRLIRFNITQIGSTIGGQDVAAHMKVLRKLAS